ncbi:MAG: deoxynucleoside kinase, partial [archaeon]|nr:deoxynucleoside kinase [archaeon]
LINAAKTEKPIIMVERSLLSNKVFFDVSASLGKLDKMEHQMLLVNYDFYTTHLYPALAGIIYLRTPLEECIKRVKRRSRSGEEEIDRAYLSVLDQSFNQFIDSLKIPKLDITESYDISDAGNVIAKINDFMHPRTDQEDKENTRVN